MTDRRSSRQRRPSRDRRVLVITESNETLGSADLARITVRGLERARLEAAAQADREQHALNDDRGRGGAHA